MNLLFLISQLTSFWLLCNREKESIMMLSNIMLITFTWTQDNRTYLFSLFQANNMKKVIWSWMVNCKKRRTNFNMQQVKCPFKEFQDHEIMQLMTWVCQTIMTARWASKTVSLKWKKVTNVPKIYRASIKKGLEKCAIETLQPCSSLKSNHLMMKFAFIFAQFYRGLNVI